MIWGCPHTHCKSGTYPTAQAARQALCPSARDARKRPALPRPPWPPAACSPQRRRPPWAAPRRPGVWAPARAHGRTSPAPARPCAPWPPQWAGTCRSPIFRCVPSGPASPRAAAAGAAAALRTARLPVRGAAPPSNPAQLPPPLPPAGQAAGCRARADDGAAASRPGAPAALARSFAALSAGAGPLGCCAHPHTPTQFRTAAAPLRRCWGGA